MLLVNHFSFAECDQIKWTFLQGRHTDGQKKKKVKSCLISLIIREM